MFKAEEEIEDMKKDKKIPNSLITRTRTSKMKIIELSIKTFIQKARKLNNPNEKISNLPPKVMKEKLNQFFTIITITTTHFNDFFYHGDKLNLVEQYFSYQTQKEVQRENSDFKGDLREVFENCPRTEIMINFSQNMVRNALSKILIKQKLPRLNKYHEENYDYIQFKPNTEQAWKAMINISKFLSIPENTKFGEFIRAKDTLNYAIFAAMVIEAKKIYLEAFYREKKLEESPMSFEKWERWMKRKKKFLKISLKKPQNLSMIQKF